MEDHYDLKRRIYPLNGMGLEINYFNAEFGGILLVYIAFC